ncbi:MAG: FGGY family carbohydrate kinase [Gammaproteobacteria bacterium]|nr:FGGY family carbohydrate kinase [Gammaproteobacteria bacterium]
MTVLAIDQGTTSTRALCVDDAGGSEITCSVKHRQHYPAPGWVEHDPEELIASLEACIESAPGAEAIGIDNQGESCLAWHADTGRAISPVIVWQDNRTEPLIEQLKRDGREAQVLEVAGLPLDSYFSASKMAWILQHCEAAPSLLRQGKLRIGTTDAFFLDRLAGRYVTDITTASRTSLLNLESGNWDEDLCALFGVPPEVLPEIVATTGDLGGVVRGKRSIPITASVVDQQASLYGHGCRVTGDMKITFGTGAFALALTGDRLTRSPEQGLLPTVAWQLQGESPVYALDGGVYCAGSAVEWGRKLELFDGYEEINRFRRGAAIERDLAFVPALSGLACPHWDRRAAGIWVGLSLDTDRRDLIQSILEGIALRAAEVVGAMDALVEIGERISIDGGLSANPYFCQFLADLLERQVTVRAMSELTALGTARLAGARESMAAAEDDSLRRYRPAADRSAARELFAEAVSRARGWRK